MHNKRMQTDFGNRYALASAADARRYKALVRDQVKVDLDCMSRLNYREYGAAEEACK